VRAWALAAAAGIGQGVGSIRELASDRLPSLAFRLHRPVGLCVRGQATITTQIINQILQADLRFRALFADAA